MLAGLPPSFLVLSCAMLLGREGTVMFGFYFPMFCMWPVGNLEGRERRDVNPEKQSIKFRRKGHVAVS